MWKELHWGVSDFTKALALSGGPANAHQKAAFAATAYTDSEVLKLYVVNAGPLQDGYRQSIIKTLDLGNNELWKEVEKVGAMAPLNKYDPALNNRELDALDMDWVIHTIQRQAVTDFE